MIAIVAGIKSISKRVRFFLMFFQSDPLGAAAFCFVRIIPSLSLPTSKSPFCAFIINSPIFPCKDYLLFATISVHGAQFLLKMHNFYGASCFLL